MKFQITGLGGGFDNEIQTVTQIFFPNESFEKFERDISGEVAQNEVSVACVLEEGSINISVCRGAQTLAQARCEPQKMPLKLALYGALARATGVKPPWGSLTGIRPSKLALDSLRQGKTQAEVMRLLTGTFDVDTAKAQLALDVALAEMPFVESGGYSLYVGIPFCPTKCLYCSFTSYPIDKYAALVGAYLDCLDSELEHIARYARGNPQSIYIGGGTPSALSHTEIERLLAIVAKHFNTAATGEYTFEAGRADTITAEKLAALRRFGVTRVCVNPQSLNDATLQHIGRGHTGEQFVQAFEMVRATGFRTINADIILGLANETTADVAATLQRLGTLSPENITVHTLALKRGSRLIETQYNLEDAAFAHNIEEMISLSAKHMAGAGLLPYYMYRQKNSLGSFENVGYSKPGHESIYNIQIMAEKQTIFAAGAGAVTKLYQAGDKLRRIFNVKFVDDYIRRIDEMIERKAELVYD
ncbi:MAG: coproporphyrinogen dehydrogenase HemZ [Defluviitaleaceae bacterium]|nr:coproporphyrinogen dehydrogenase HemZ [Defluviitaleaceae bacterium]